MMDKKYHLSDLFESVIRLRREIQKIHGRPVGYGEINIGLLPEIYDSLIISANMDDSVFTSSFRPSDLFNQNIAGVTFSPYKREKWN